MGLAWIRAEHRGETVSQQCQTVVKRWRQSGFTVVGGGFWGGKWWFWH